MTEVTLFGMKIFSVSDMSDIKSRRDATSEFVFETRRRLRVEV